MTAEEGVVADLAGGAKAKAIPSVKVLRVSSSRELIIEMPLIISGHDRNTSTAPSTGDGALRISTENLGTTERIRNPADTA